MAPRRWSQASKRPTDWLAAIERSRRSSLIKREIYWECFGITLTHSTVAAVWMKNWLHANKIYDQSRVIRICCWQMLRNLVKMMMIMEWCLNNWRYTHTTHLLSISIYLLAISHSLLFNSLKIHQEWIGVEWNEELVAWDLVCVSNQFRSNSNYDSDDW